jgi:hypothetical protein
VAAIDVVRALAGMGSVAVWIGGVLGGVIAVLMVFVGVVVVAALKANTPELQRYRLRLLREVLRFVRDLFQIWTKR